MKLTLTQRARKVHVYDWAMLAAKDILESVIVTRMLIDGTNEQLYLAETITNHFENGLKSTRALSVPGTPK